MAIPWLAISIGASALAGGLQALAGPDRTPSEDTEEERRLALEQARTQRELDRRGGIRRTNFSKERSIHEKVFDALARNSESSPKARTKKDLKSLLSAPRREALNAGS